MSLTIIADNREKSSGVPTLLSNEGIYVEMSQLYVGDYIVNNEIIIERKTNIDFVQSIITGHLFDQCVRLRKTNKLSLIIIEGSPYKTRHKIDPKAIKGAILSVTLSWQIPIIHSYGKKDTVRLIIMSAMHQTESPIYIRRTGIKPKKLQRQQHYFVQGIPGVGSELAQRLLVHFGTIEKIVTSDIKKLLLVDGIGKAKATRLYEFFRSKKGT